MFLCHVFMVWTVWTILLAAGSGLQENSTQPPFTHISAKVFLDGSCLQQKFGKLTRLVWGQGARLLHSFLFFDDLTKIWWNEPISFLVSKTWVAGGTRTLGLHLPAPHLLRWTLREGKSVRSPAGAAPFYWWGGSTMHDVVIGVAQGFGYCLSSWCSSCYTFDSWLL